MIAYAPGETRVMLASGWGDDETPLAPLVIVKTGESDARLRELVELDADWDGYGARPIDSRAVAVAAGMVHTLSRVGFRPPEIFPVPNGGVQLEWCAGPMELEVEIEPGASSAIFVADDRATGRHFDGQFPRDMSLWRQALAALASHVR